MIGFAPPPHAAALRDRVRAFVEEHVIPREAELAEGLDAEVGPGRPFSSQMTSLRARARDEGLWNLHLPEDAGGPGLGHLDYAIVCEETGRSLAAPMVFNTQPPDSGNAEILHQYGTDDQRERWLAPLLAGESRTCFAMTEPEVAGSDPTLIQAAARTEDGEWVIDGHKWFATGAVGAALVIVMCVTDPDRPSPHQRASMLLVPADADGLELVRPVPVMGHAAGPGHGELRFTSCRIPAAEVLGPRAGGFAIAQERLGPGRLHHCLRAVGGAERALELLCWRAATRHAFGGPLADKQFIQELVAGSRMQIDQARLLSWRAAWKMDTEGKAHASKEISMAKIAAAAAQQDVLDRAMQVHGALGLTEDTPIAGMWRHARGLRILDGADEVHKMSIARHELRPWRPGATTA
jgi:acyl-CoA dehydrogenase